MKVQTKKEIYFNSKSREFWKLSNFYGGVEKEFMKDRFLDKKVRNWMDGIEKYNKDKFIHCLKLLQPEKKKWTPGKLKYWIRNDEEEGEILIKGILYKLIGTSVKDTAVGKRRRKIIMKELDLDDLEVKPNTKDSEKKELMLKLLRKKFSKKEYKDELLRTGTMVLHEKPLRGGTDNWTYKNGEGGDWLGKILMKVREEIRGKEEKKK
jgi:hypothetical protein